MYLFTFIACIGLGGLAFLIARRNPGTPFAAHLRLVRNWLWFIAIPLSVLLWLSHAHISLLPSIPPGFTVLFPGYRQLADHRINAPKNGRKRIVVLGASTMAGWGTDYRGSLFDHRHRHDIWGRTSLPASLEAELQRRGIEATVENLGINYGAICSEFAIFLYALERQPDLIIHGITAGSFATFDLSKIPELMTEIPLRLRIYSYPQKSELEKPLLELLAQNRVASTHTPTLKESLHDGLVRWAGNLLVGVYHNIGLPPIIVKPENPMPSSEELRKRFDQPTDAWRRQFEVLGLGQFANLPLMMHQIAETQHIPYVTVFPPSLYLQDHTFYHNEYGPMLRGQNLPVIDLSEEGLRYGTESYDGLHSTPAGNAITARNLADQLIDIGVLP